VSAHIVMPARRSYVPGQYVRRCSAVGCLWVRHSRSLERLQQWATAHHEDPEAEPELPLDTAQ
jgi:hypothetical protein